jgi:zinc protease
MGHLQMGERTFHFEHHIELFEAKNGMRIAILPDPRTNLVTVDVRYAVGEAEDPDGRHGLAHLVEHTTFLSRAAAGGPTIGDRLGDDALSFNAYTTPDETHYTETGFSDHLDALLAIEAERMTEGCDQIDDALFLRERDVVLEELAQRGGPLVDVQDELAASVWGADHPYGRPFLSRDVADATRDDACAFLTSYYGPQHAILVVTGNVDLDAATAAIGSAFGPIATRGDAHRAPLPPLALDGETSTHDAPIEDATASVYFPAPRWGGEQVAPFHVVEAYLGTELAARDRGESWVTGTSVDEVGGYRARALAVSVSVDDPARLDDAIELIYARGARLAERGYWQGWRSVVTELGASLVADYDRFEGRGSWIADFLQYTTHNRFFLADMEGFDAVTPTAASRWAGENLPRASSHAAKILPSGDAASRVRVSVTSQARTNDVAPWRTPVDPAEATRALVAGTSRVAADVTDFELPNGLRVLLAPDASSAIVDARLVFPVGTAADPADRPGLAYATAALIAPDPIIRDDDVRAEVKWALTSVGTEITSDVSEQGTTFRATGLGVFADWHVWTLFFWLDHSEFRQDDIDSMHRAAAEAGDPDQDVRMAALREHLFGAGHPYAGAALTGDDIRKIGRKDLERFRKGHYKAKGATLVVSGGFDVAAMKTEIEDVYGTWDRGAPAAIAAVPAATPARGPSWIGVRDPAATQAAVTIAFATGSSPEDDRAVRMVLEQLLEDRLRVVREGLGASYGLSVQYYGATSAGALTISGMLDPERAGDAMKAIVAELARLRDPATDLAEDFVRARRLALALALADTAGAAATADELAFVGAHHLDRTYFAELAGAVAGATVDDVRALIGGDLAEPRMVVAVGARAEVCQAIFEHLGAKAEMLDRK